MLYNYENLDFYIFYGRRMRQKFSAIVAYFSCAETYHHTSGVKCKSGRGASGVECKSSEDMALGVNDERTNP